MNAINSVQRYILVISVLLAAEFGIRAQGTILFNNRNLDFPDGGGCCYDAPVTLPDGSGAAGTAFTAGLFLVDQGSLTLLATTQFRTGIAAGYFVDPPVVSVPGHPGFSPATFRLRVWDTTAGSYEMAVALTRLHGEFPTDHPDNNLFVPSLGPALPGGPAVPANLSGIQPLTLVPEPTAAALLSLAGIFYFALRRRRKKGCMIPD